MAVINKCCANLWLNTIIGTPPDLDGGGEEPPDIPGSLYFTQINFTGLGETLVMGSYGSLPVFDPGSLASTLQSLVIAQSGAAYFAGTSQLIFWLLSDVEPVGWTFDGNPINWQLSPDPVAIGCYDSGVINFTVGEPNSSDWYNFDWTIFGNNCETGSSLAYDSAGYAALFPTLVTQLFGVGVTGQFIVSATTIRVKIFDTYIIPTNITSYSITADIQTNPLNPSSCDPIVPNPLPLIFSFTAIGNAPVADPSNVEDWNAALFPTIPFDSVVVNGDDVELYGYDGTGLSGFSFNSFTDLLAVNDSGGIITSIGSYFFAASGCTSIIMDSLLDTDNNFADGCIDLLTVSINSCTSIGQFAFQGCEQLTTISGPIVTTILQYAFNDCFTLNDISFPLVTSIGDYGFADCLLTGALDLSSLTTVGEYTFSICGFTDVNIPTLLTAGLNSFSDCPNLINITLAALTSCGGSFVRNCLVLESINVPLCEDFGGTTGDDTVFEFITGQTITCTVPVSRQTCDGGNPDGDLVYLLANNPASTINYV